MKVWQTKADYFFSPAAATSLAASGVGTPMMTENRQDGSTDTSDDDLNVLSIALPIVLCTLFGVVLGGAAVIIFLSIRTRRGRVGMYREVDGSDHGSTPAVQATL